MKLEYEKVVEEIKKLLDKAKNVEGNYDDFRKLDIGIVSEKFKDDNNFPYSEKKFRNEIFIWDGRKDEDKEVVKLEEEQKNMLSLIDNVDDLKKKAMIYSKEITPAIKEALSKELGITGQGGKKMINVIFKNVPLKEKEYQIEINKLKSENEILKDKIKDLENA